MLRVEERLLIGVSKYPEYAEEEHLQYATLDALKFAAVLRNNATEDFVIESKRDSDATRADILSAMDAMRSDAARPETL